MPTVRPAKSLNHRMNALSRQAWHSTTNSMGHKFLQREPHCPETQSSDAQIRLPRAAADACFRSPVGVDRLLATQSGTCCFPELIHSRRCKSLRLGEPTNERLNYLPRELSEHPIHYTEAQCEPQFVPLCCVPVSRLRLTFATPVTRELRMLALAAPIGPTIKMLAKTLDPLKQRTPEIHRSVTAGEASVHQENDCETKAHLERLVLEIIRLVPAEPDLSVPKR